MFPAVHILTKWAEVGQRWRQQLCSLGLGTSRAQVPFAEQIHVHLSSMKMGIFSAEFTVVFLHLEDSLAHIHNFC